MYKITKPFTVQYNNIHAYKNTLDRNKTNLCFVEDSYRILNDGAHFIEL